MVGQKDSGREYQIDARQVKTLNNNIWEWKYEPSQSESISGCIDFYLIPRTNDKTIGCNIIHEVEEKKAGRLWWRTGWIGMRRDRREQGEDQRDFRGSEGKENIGEKR